MRDFDAALKAAERDMGGKGIGTIGEKTLHLALKYYFAPDPETHERPIGGFIADAVTEEGVFEIQTRGLSRLKPKLDAFLPLCPVTVVHPVADPKWVCRVDEFGEILSRRKSPKHESVITAMREIYTLRDYFANPNFQICICTVELTEFVVRTGGQKRLKLDRVPLTLRAEQYFRCGANFAALLPPIREPFTIPELTEALHVPEMQVRMFVSILVRFGILAEAGKSGRMKLWRRTDSDTIGG